MRTRFQSTRVRTRQLFSLLTLLYIVKYRQCLQQNFILPTLHNCLESITLQNEKGNNASPSKLCYDGFYLQTLDLFLKRK